MAEERKSAYQRQRERLQNEAQASRRALASGDQGYFRAQARADYAAYREQQAIDSRMALARFQNNPGTYAAIGATRLSLTGVEGIQSLAQGIGGMSSQQTGAGIAGSLLGGASSAVRGGASALAQLGPHGMLAGAGLMAAGTPLFAAQGLLSGANAMLGQYGQYSGATAVAMAQAQAANEMGNISRANFLAPQLAEFATAQSKVEQQGKDVLAQLMKPAIPVVTKVLEFLADFLEWLKDKIQKFEVSALEYLITIVEALNNLPAVNINTDEMKKLLKEIRDGIKDPQGEDPFLTEFLQMRIPKGDKLTDEGARAAGKDIGALAGRLNTPFALP